MAKTTPRRRSSGKDRGAASKPASEITTFHAAVRHLYDRVDLERMRLVRYDDDTFKLQRMAELMDALGNPHQHVRMVHVAGTVGKGSTTAMLASMLQGCGYAVGAYTSPHLMDVRERIAINGAPIGRSEFVELTSRVSRGAEELGIEPTFFELTTAMAFCHFAEQAVDMAVVETGLGGRLDSTNVITPEVIVITAIDYDHTHLLGTNLPAIAAEKAGIFKRGVPIVSVDQDPEVEQVLRAKAAELDAPISFVSNEIEYSVRFGTTPDLGPHCRVCLVTPTLQLMHLPVPLPGEHQAQNCAAALAAADTLRRVGFECDEAALLEGLARTTVPGRMELIWKRPRILIDGAHNPASLAALMRSVGAHVPYDSMVCIFGCCDDKNVPEMLRQVARGGDKIIFTKARGTPRAMDPAELQARFAEEGGKMSQTAESLSEALDLAQRAVGRDDLICITGSFYLVGDAKKHFAELAKRRS